MDCNTSTRRLRKITTNCRQHVKFYHSLVISICSSLKHANAANGQIDPGYLLLEARSASTGIQANNPTISPVAPQGSILLDLHTKTALIGRKDLDVTLEYLRLHDQPVYRSLCRTKEPAI